MPFVAIASATDLIKSSLTLQANLFQLFHPIGGVCANSSRGFCALAWLAKKAAAIKANPRIFPRFQFISFLLWTLPSDLERTPGSPGSTPATVEHWQYNFRFRGNKAAGLTQLPPFVCPTDKWQEQNIPSRCLTHRSSSRRIFRAEARCTGSTLRAI